MDMSADYRLTFFVSADVLTNTFFLIPTILCDNSDVKSFKLSETLKVNVFADFDLTFDLRHSSSVRCHVVNRSTKFKNVYLRPFLIGL